MGRWGLGAFTLLMFAACTADPSGHREAQVGASGGSGGSGASGQGGGLDVHNPVVPDAGPGADADMTGTGGMSGANAGSGGRMCGPAGCGQTITGHGGVVDMLFVVDDSGSMREEQASLAREFPRLLRKLTTGDHDEDGEAEYEAVLDLHLGVISTNLGGSLPGTTCTDEGDSGRLRHTPSGPGCSGPYPPFLSYLADRDDPEAIATDFACLTSLGTTGCGYEQPLEAALQALWPSADPRLRFIGPTTAATLGRGDRDNAGFLRNEPDAAATLAIVVVSDEDDCSMLDPRVGFPTHLLAIDDPLVEQNLNLRCHYNPERLYDLERYAVGYRALHGWTGARVLFAAIVGVPVELVDQVALAEVNWNDEAEREAHYDTILEHPEMQEVPIDSNGSGHFDELAPSCVSEHGEARPPRRIVSLARKFGPNSLVQSICGDNLGPPIDIIIRQVLEGPQ